MSVPAEEAGGRQRLAASLAIILFASVVITTFVTVISNPLRLAAQLLLLAGAALAGWYALTRAGRARALAILIVLASLTGLVLVGFAKEGGGPVSLLARVLLLMLGVSLTRFALARDVTLGSRPGLDAGRLGVVSLEIRSDSEGAMFLASLATGHPERFHGLRSWATPSFEMSSGSSIDVGLDGETISMDPLEA